MTASPTAYTPEELVDILKVTKRTVYQFLRDGRLRGVKIGDTWRVSQEEVHRFMGVNIGSTLGEKYFAYYLNQNGIPFEFEKEWRGKKRRPDFSIPYEGRYYLFEVKDLHAPLPPLGFSTFDPIKPITDHINEAQKKFKEFPDESCSIVLFNRSAMTFLDDPFTMFGAMHGRPEIQIPYDTTKGQLVFEERRNVLSRKGAKMTPAGRATPQNTRISSLIGIRTVDIGMTRMARYLHRFPGDTWLKHLRDDVQEFDPNEVRIGLTIWENRDAKVRLPEGLLSGPYDARWSGPDDEGIERTFLGPGLEEYERLGKELAVLARSKFNEDELPV
ncbi:MAG: helix-turn-helix domain-containing protein [Thermoanaerobaculia bacterium]